MSESTWKISDRTGYEAAGTVMPAGFAASVNNHSNCTEAKISLESQGAAKPDIKRVREQIVDAALKMTASLPEQRQRRDIESRIAEAKEQEKRLGELRLLHATAKGERDAFTDYSAADAGQRLVELGRKIDDLKQQINILGEPATVLSALQAQLATSTQHIANMAKAVVVKQAIKQATDQLLSRRAALLRQLEAAVSPILDELALTDIAYTQTMLDANPTSGTLPREIEAAIRQAIGADDPAMRVNPVPTVPAVPTAAATSITLPRQYGPIPAAKREGLQRVGLQS